MDSSPRVRRRRLYIYVHYLRSLVSILSLRTSDLSAIWLSFQSSRKKQIHDHMADMGLYPIAQSAYRENHSTETALLKVKNDILLNMNKQHVTLLVLLDFIVAFNTVDHGILLEALNKLGLGGKAFEWFQSYLSGRCQRISVRGCQSERLLDVIQDYLPSVHCYADDTQLYISFSLADETGHSAAITAIERCIQVIRNWMHDNKLLLNEVKTEFLLIGTKQQLAKVNILHVKVGNANVAPHSPVKNRELWFASNLSMVDHITKTSSAAFYHLYNIRRIRMYLTKECTNTDSCLYIKPP